MFFNLSVLSKSPVEMFPPIGVILELRSHANLPFRKLALKILIEFVLNLNWWFHEETAHWTNRLFSIEKKKFLDFEKKIHTQKKSLSVSHVRRYVRVTDAIGHNSPKSPIPFEC